MYVHVSMYVCMYVGMYVPSSSGNVLASSNTTAIKWLTILRRMNRAVSSSIPLKSTGIERDTMYSGEVVDRVRVDINTSTQERSEVAMIRGRGPGQW